MRFTKHKNNPSHFPPPSRLVRRSIEMNKIFNSNEGYVESKRADLCGGSAILQARVSRSWGGGEETPPREGVVNLEDGDCTLGGGRL